MNARELNRIWNGQPWWLLRYRIARFFGRIPGPMFEGGYGQFTCPKCGSHMFGSGSWQGVQSGYCHGLSGCRFSWNRRDADHLYFSRCAPYRPLPQPNNSTTETP